MLALTDEFLPPGVITVRTSLPTRDRKELAAQACDALARLGLAETHYDGRWYRWRRASPGQRQS
ncbi:hypothetical protein [Methylobacterium nigriterrae]|uniref:hypothetical protein n=1 Tax=Methylobacterium nigriterrae TaxID=3127512 RepID=UPI0030140EBF